MGSGGTRYVLGDMTGFDVGSFAEVIVPNATFAFLRSRRERADCLTAIHRALLPEGVLWIDMPMPDFSLIGTPHSPERDSWQGEVEDRLVRRTRETFRRPEEGLLLLVDRFYSGQEQLAESRLQLHIALPEELEWAIESCGFYVDGRYGGYSDQPLAPGVPRVLIRAVRA